MQLITTRNKEISFAELKKAISSGNGLELIHPGDKFAIELKNGELVNAVCGGYVNEKRARFVLEDCLAEKWRMNDTPTNKGGYLKSEGRRHVLEDILPLFPDRATWIFTTPHTRRAMQASEIKARYDEWCSSNGRSSAMSYVCDDVRSAVALAIRTAGQFGGNPLIYIGGSTFVVSEAMPCFR